MTNLTAAELAQQTIDKIEDLAAALAALGRDDLLSDEQARAMCAQLDDIVTGLLHCPADDTADLDPCVGCAGYTCE